MSVPYHLECQSDHFLTVAIHLLVVPPVMVVPPWKPTGEPPNKDVGKGNVPSGDDNVDMVKKSGIKWPVEFSTKVILILSPTTTVIILVIYDSKT